MSRFIVRLDDICPTMNWRRFEHFADQMMQAGVHPLLGIVPDCRDPHLMVDAPRSDFWQVMRDLKNQGWCISQHGYTHVYDSQPQVDPADNLLRRNARSEFAGHPESVQFTRLREGAAIMAENGLATDVFMAPAHTFDLNTLKALRANAFRYVTDGYGLWPYVDHDLIFVPQLFERPLHIGVGKYTLCLHLNEMPDANIAALVQFVKKHRDDFVDFKNAMPRSDLIAQSARVASSVCIRAARGLMKTLRRH
jgi:predicted deacetylase